MKLTHALLKAPVIIIGLLLSCGPLLAAEAEVAADSGVAAKKTSKDVAARSPEKTFRIYVIGASISAGFGSGTSISEVLDVAIDAPKAISDKSSMSFFMDPVGKAHSIMPAIYKSKPSLVLGVDFLFWFGYGPGSLDSRIWRVQRALRLLDKLECPVIVGDLPQFSQSFMLPSEVIPAKSDLDKINKLIHAWAKKKKNVYVYPMAALVEDIRAGNTILVNGKKTKLEESKMFQIDGLHITRSGLVILVSKILERFPPVNTAGAKDPLIKDPSKLVKRLAAKRMEAKRLEARRLEAKRRAEAKRRSEAIEKAKSESAPKQGARP